MKLNIRLPTAFFALFAAQTSAGKYCPPVGAVLPPPTAPGKSHDVQTAAKQLTSTLDKQFKSSLNASGVSIGVKSIHEHDLLFNYHYTPPVLSGIGTDSIDEHTIFRVGSVSKLVTALAALQNSQIDMEASVLKYFPELGNSTSTDPVATVQWEDVTIRSLANHLSGLATNTAMDLSVFPLPWDKVGLPKIPQGEEPQCSGIPGTKRTCTTADLIRDLNKRPPVYRPHSRPVYSNTGYALLGAVIEAATDKTFKDVVQSGIYDGAGMNSSSFDGPVKAFEERGFVPMGDTTWNATLGVYESAGGMFSSTVDLIALAEGIYTNQFLPPAQTREWMKPNAHTASLGQSVGAPWEILRSNKLTSDGRVIDVYTKTGDLGLYHAHLGIVPDYDIVFSVIAAGPEVSIDSHSRTKIFSTVIKSLLPAIEKAGKQEAASANGYVGTYTERTSNSTVTLKLDAGPGLVISDWTARGFDVLHNFESIDPAALAKASATNSTIPGHLEASVDARMYLTDATDQTEKKHCSNGTVEMAWRAIIDTTTASQKEDLASELFYEDGSCESWFMVESAAYNYKTLTEFVFVADKKGAIVALKNLAFNTTMTKHH